ncbi:MAG TPA: hypothetical protein VKQ28_16770 [Candidatus Acidoferrum sp.]|nr:hypothetical protein [Candidatus Acidoferrum sp.]
MSELRTSLAIGKARWVLAGAGGGAGLAVGLAAVRSLTARPEFLPQLLNGGFLYFSVLVVGMVIASKKMDTFTAMHERTVVAQEQLASNVGALVAKDTQREREQELLLNHLTRTNETILERLDELKALHG